MFQKWTRSQTKELVTCMIRHFKLSSQRNKVKRVTKNEKSLWDFGTQRKKKLHYGNPEEKEKGTESIPKATMDENFLNLGREMDI